MDIFPLSVEEVLMESFLYKSAPICGGSVGEADEGSEDEVMTLNF